MKMTTISFTYLDSEEIDPLEAPFQPSNGKNIPLFGKPKEIGHFSIDAKRKIHFDKSQMKYLIPFWKIGDFNFDLNKNFSTDVIHNYVTINKMYQILYWLKYHKDILQPRSAEATMKTSCVDFVTGRGTLSLISCTPYLKECLRNQWEVCATKYNGIIYLSLVDSDIDIAEEETASDRKKRFQSWGYKFEQYITTANQLFVPVQDESIARYIVLETSEYKLVLCDRYILTRLHERIRSTLIDHIDGNPDLSSATHQLEEYNVILKNVLNKHSLLYKAEMDAVIPHRGFTDGSGDTSCYTEIKTSRIMTSSVDQYKFHKYKAIMWWAQSYFAGISEIICGNRTNQGIVKSIDIHRVSAFPEEARGLWSPDVCLNFCDKFLTYLKRVVTEDDYNVVYKFNYRSGDIVYSSKLINPENRYRIIPEWYKRAMEE